MKEIKYKKLFKIIFDNFEKEFKEHCGYNWVFTLHNNSGIEIENPVKNIVIEILYPTIHYDYRLRKFDLLEFSPVSFYKTELEIILKYIKKLGKIYRVK